MSIFSQLPNDLIMRIIRETKTSLDFKEDHERKWTNITYDIMGIIGYQVYNPNADQDPPESDQSFGELYQNGSLTDTIIKYRRNGHR